MKHGKATNQMLIIYAFLDVVLMLIYQRMKDLKWILKQRRASSLDMALVLKGRDSLIQTHRKSSIAEMSYLMKQHQETEEVENQPFVEVECENISSDDDENSREATEPRRSPRIWKAPDQDGEWVYIAHRVDDPLTVKEALSSPEKREWVKAMEREINWLNTNKVWDLAELPCGRKVIGSKWVFKRKYDSGGNMKQPKARLVAQGFLQKHGDDYDENFCPVLTTVRISSNCYSISS